MLIESLWIENFRSIRKLRLDGLGAFNVFYGENGAGKSNLLEAIERLADALALWVTSPLHPGVQTELPDADFSRPESGPLVIGAVFVSAGAHEHGLPERLEFAFEAGIAKRRPAVVLARADGKEVGGAEFGADPRYRAWFDHFRSIAAGFRLLPASRSLGVEDEFDQATPLSGANRIAFLLLNGRLKQALVEAVTSPDLGVRTGLKHMQKVFAGAPLHRPSFDPIFDPAAKRYELNEIRFSPDGTAYAIPVDLAGLGIQQVYAVMAGIFLGGASIVAVEEPEAHLHPRTTGLQLRTLLKRAVDEGHIDQLFIATHSNLFDLDPTGYFYVRNDEKLGTVVERRADFAQLDRDVFWEPGPARHALTDMLRYLPADAPVFKRPDGTSITAAEMLGLLQADDPAAIAFVDDVQSTAVHTVQRLAQRKK